MRYTPEQYIKERVDDQIDWYGRKSSFNKKLFTLFRIVEIILSALIPLLSGFLVPGHVWVKLLIAIIGVTITIIAGCLSLLKWQENWIQYRSTSESLKHEKFLFLCGTPPYNEDSAFELFVERIECLISKENSDWAQSITHQKTEKTTEP